MSKKSRKRNKKILAALALAGGAAMLAKGRGQGVAQGVGGADKAAFTSDAAYKLPKTDYINKKVAAPVLRKPPIGKMRGVGTDAEAIAGQDKRANYAKQARINAINTAEGSPSIDNPYQFPRVHNRLSRLKGGGIAKRGSGVALKKGGRVTGIAKRGFGRALMKGKK